MYLHTSELKFQINKITKLFFAIKSKYEYINMNRLEDPTSTLPNAIQKLKHFGHPITSIWSS